MVCCGAILLYNVGPEWLAVEDGPAAGGPGEGKGGSTPRGHGSPRRVPASTEEVPMVGAGSEDPEDDDDADAGAGDSDSHGHNAGGADDDGEAGTRSGGNTRNPVSVSVSSAEGEYSGVLGLGPGRCRSQGSLMSEVELAQMKPIAMALGTSPR